MELEALKRKCASDLSDREVCLSLVGTEIQRRLATGATEVWLKQVLRALGDDLWQILDEADFDWYEAGYEYGEFPLDSGEILESLAKNLLTSVTSTGDATIYRFWILARVSGSLRSPATRNVDSTTTKSRARSTYWTQERYATLLAATSGPR